MSSADTSWVKECTVGRQLKAVNLGSELVSAVVLVDQGADINQLVYRPLGIDVLWKPHRPPREPGIGPLISGDSMTLWIDYFRGGWNLIFPNFGPAVQHRGLPMEFHGEAARVAWSIGAVEVTDRRASVTLEVELPRSPFHIRRVVSVESGDPALSVEDTVTNDGCEPMECMWAHHPAFGAPLISPECTIELDAEFIESDDGYDVPANDLPLGQTWTWPQVTNRHGASLDLSRMPGPESRHMRVMILKQFKTPRYRLVNRRIGLGVEMSWDRATFPYANFWQESGGTTGYPFFGRAYVLAIEPMSSYPAHGIVEVMRTTRTHLTFQPGEKRTAAVRAAFFEL